MRSIALVALLSLLSHVASISLWAAPPSRPAPRPVAPPALTVKGPIDGFTCQRYFVYQDKVISCDSNIRLDGEKLRPIIQDVPEAVAELNLYQRNRLRIRNAAYTGTLGLVVMLGGYLLSSRYKGPDGKPNDTGNSIRNISLISGGGLAGGSFLYALSFIKTNETHLGNAVNYYNQARPDNPIELRFSTGISF